MTVPERLSALRKCMEEKNIDVYVVPTADFHQSEYVGVIDEYFERIADLVGQRNITVGQQYFVLFVVDQIESVVRDAVYGEGLCASCFEHNGCFILTKVRFIFAESNF